MQSKVGQVLEQASNNCVELKLAGQFMAEAGAVVRNVVAGFGTSCRISSDMSVESVSQVSVSNGTDKPRRELWKVAARRNPSDANADPPLESIYAERVVLATGGSQKVPQLPCAAHAQKSVTSDFICTRDGVAWLHDRLLKAKGPGTNRDRKVVIVGGSHSAFSAAWICLYKVDPQVAVFASGSVCILHRSPVPVFYNTKKEAELDGYTDFKHMNSMGQIHPFGGIRGDAKSLYRQIRTMKEQRVRMLMLKGGSSAPAATKLFDDATVIIWACGYGTNLIPVQDAEGTPYEFSTAGGQIEVDDEARVLCIAKQQEPAAANQNAGSVVTPASPTPTSPMRVAVASPLLSPKPTGFLVVVNNAPRRVVPVPNLFATGLGYGLKATFENGEPDGSSGRADGVAVYLKRSATLILSSVLGPKVYGDNATSWKQRIANTLALAGAEKRQPNAADTEGIVVDSSSGANQLRSPTRPASSPSRSSGTPTAASPARGGPTVASGVLSPTPAVPTVSLKSPIRQIREGFVAQAAASPQHSTILKAQPTSPTKAGSSVMASPIRVPARRVATANATSEVSRSLNSSIRAPQSKASVTKVATIMPAKAQPSTNSSTSSSGSNGSGIKPSTTTSSGPNKANTLPSLSAGKQQKPVSSRLFDAAKMTKPLQPNKSYRVLESAVPPANVILDTSKESSIATQPRSPGQPSIIFPSQVVRKDEPTAKSSPSPAGAAAGAGDAQACAPMSPIRPHSASANSSPDAKSGSVRTLSGEFHQLSTSLPAPLCKLPSGNNAGFLSSKLSAGGKRVVAGWR